MMSENKEKKVGLWKKAVLGLAFLTTTSAAMAQKTTVKHKKVNPTELSANALKRVKNAQCTVKITETEGVEDLAKLTGNTSEIKKEFDFEKSAKIAQRLGMQGEMKAYRIGTNTAFIYNPNGFVVLNFETGEAVGVSANGKAVEGKLDNYIVHRKSADKPEDKKKANELLTFDDGYFMDVYPDLNNLNLATKFKQSFNDRFICEAFVTGVKEGFPDAKSPLVDALTTYKFESLTGYEHAGQMNKACALVKGVKEKAPEI